MGKMSFFKCLFLLIIIPFFLMVVLVFTEETVFAQNPPSRFGQKGKKAFNSFNKSKFQKGLLSQKSVKTGKDSSQAPFVLNKTEKSESKKSGGKNKMSFATAHPEDITDENFPEIIESFDYPNADVMDVATAIGKLTKKNFIIESGLNGKITIVAPTPVTVAQAWKLFLTALAMNGFSIVPTNDGYMKIRKSDKAVSDSIETYSGDYYPTFDQMITRIIRLKYIQASSLKDSLKDFVPKGKSIGKFSAYDDTNSVIISGYGSSVHRMSNIIEQLDRPGFEERLEVIPIRYAKSKDISDLISKIIKGGGKKKTSTRFSRSRLKNTGEKTESLKLVEPDQRTNSIIVVGNTKGIQRIKKLVKQLDYPLDPADAGGVHVYYVKHGSAEQIAGILSGVAQGSEKIKKDTGSKKQTGSFVSPPKAKKPIFGGNVDIKADENTNSLVIIASKQDYQVVRSILAKIDIPKDQVFVEAVIMEMEATNSDIWNMNYMRFFKKDDEDGSTGTSQVGGAARVGFSGGANSIADLLSPTGGKGAILNLGDPSETIQITTPGGPVEIPTLLALINFLKEKTNANILSTPNILAMDNEESEIEVGEEVPVGGTQNFSNQGITSITPQFQNATILLKIKPFISRESEIVRLEVEQKIQKVSTKPIKAEALAQSTQALTKKALKTKIVLESGQTAVLGGLMEDEDSIQEAKIPLLGDIPLLGWLFKNRTLRKVKKNLVVFLTPKIIRNSEGHRELLYKKMNQRIDWIKKYNGGRDPYGERFNELIEDSVSSVSSGQNNQDNQEFDLEETVFEDEKQESQANPTPLGGYDTESSEAEFVNDPKPSDSSPLNQKGLVPFNSENPVSVDQPKTGQSKPDESLEYPESVEDSSIFWETTPASPPTSDDELKSNPEEAFQ